MVSPGMKHPFRELFLHSVGQFLTDGRRQVVGHLSVPTCLYVVLSTSYNFQDLMTAYLMIYTHCIQIMPKPKAEA